ncbi:MAG TPA: SufD family Fe-S cluster assembly protein [Roseiarcus sp.]|jgi:Fe-S cluster assembly protein SufD
MSLERVIAKTAAETTLAAQFAALRSAAPSVQREAAFRRFEQSGLPTRRVESWHYTDLRAALVSAAPIAAAPAAAAIEAARGMLASLARIGASRVALVDGHYVAALSDAPPSGVAIFPVTPDTPPLGDADPVLALNVALAQGGCALTFEAGADAPLVEIVHIFTPGAEAVYSRLAITLGAAAQAKVVERFVGAGAQAQRNVSTWIDVAKDAKASHVVSIEDEAGVHVESQVVSLAEGAALDAFGLIAGGALARRQIFATLAGERARIGLGGLSLVDGRRHADTTLEVIHAAPNGESREFYRHIVADEGVGVYQGKVIVRQYAQKTDGGMKSQAILLSPNASMNNKPELEILADDVVCGHGATVGALDPEQIFYLQARGLPRREAEAMVLEAFGAEAIARVADPKIDEVLSGAMRAWLARRAGMEST